MIEDTLSRTVIGCAMDVHRELGPGYLEKVYENALSIALSDVGVAVTQQVSIPAQFRGRVVGDFVADLLVEGKLIVELKAVSNLLPVHETQLVSYLKSTGMDVGLLLNFGAGSLQIKRKYRMYRPPAASASSDRITGFSGFTGGSSPLPVDPANASLDRITGFSGFTGGSSPLPVDPANASLDRITGFSGFTGGSSPLPVDPANPAILSQTPEDQGGAEAPNNNPVHPANPEILSKLPEQGLAGDPNNNPVDPANPGILSKNGAWQ